MNHQFSPAHHKQRVVTTHYGQLAESITVRGDAEAADARVENQIETFAKLSPEERKQLVLSVTKKLHDRGGKLTQADGMRAFKLAQELEFEDLKLARETYQDFVKTFADAENKQIASFSKFFESAMKNLDKLGKEIEIAGKTTDGKDFNLKNLKGKVVLVDFWATWCGPCLAEIPNMVTAHKKYHGKGFEIIGLSLDRDEEKLSKFMEVRKLPWTSINIEDSRKWATKYEVRAIPHAVLVEFGNLALQTVQPRLFASDQLRERLLAYRSG